MSKEETKKINLLIPEYLEEIYATGGAVASSPFNIRLILFNDEIIKDGSILDSGNIDLVRTAKTEIIMHPAVAKQIADLLNDEISKYEEKLKQVNE